MQPLMTDALFFGIPETVQSLILTTVVLLMNKDEVSVYFPNPGLIGLLDRRVPSLQEEAILLENMFARFT